MNEHRYTPYRTNFNGREDSCIRCGLPELHWIHEVDGCGFCLLAPIVITHNETEYIFMSRKAAFKAGFHI